MPRNSEPYSLGSNRDLERRIYEYFRVSNGVSPQTVARDLGLDVETVRPTIDAFERAGVFERSDKPEDHTNAPH